MITRDEFEAVRARLEVLEAECAAARRSARVWRRLAGFGFALLTAAALIGPPREAQARADNDITVEAHRFVLKDGSGKIRGVFQMGENGPNLSLFREDGKFAAALGATKTDAFVRLYDTKQVARASLGTYEERGHPQLVLQEGPDKAAVVAGWRVKTGEGPSVRVYDEAGKRRALFGIAKPEPTAPKPVPVIQFNDELEKVIFSKP